MSFTLRFLHLQAQLSQLIKGNWWEAILEVSYKFNSIQNSFTTKKFQAKDHSLHLIGLMPLMAVYDPLLSSTSINRALRSLSKDQKRIPRTKIERSKKSSSLGFRCLFLQIALHSSILEGNKDHKKLRQALSSLAVSLKAFDEAPIASNP